MSLSADSKSSQVVNAERDCGIATLNKPEWAEPRMKPAERTLGVKIRWSSDRLSLRRVGGGSPLTAVTLEVPSNIDRISQTKGQNIGV